MPVSPPGSDPLVNVNSPVLWEPFAAMLLLVDDDERFRQRLAKALRQRGEHVVEASGHEAALAAAASAGFTRAVLDLRMPGKSGLDVLHDLRSLQPEVRVVVLTAYGSIATAVDAVRRGAIDYVTKPCDADRLLAAFEGDSVPETLEDADRFETPSLARVEFEHIERVVRECNGNISRAARVLGIHRRTLQYKLAKYPTLR